MKYIKERKLFISNFKQPSELLANFNFDNQESNLITEIVGNDIRFGGTWFGRLINSSIRRATNAYKGTQIQGLVTKVRDQLYLMLDENMSSELKNEYGYYLYRIAMSNIDNMVKNDDINFEEKKFNLIGKNGDGGLVQIAIDCLTELNLKNKPGDYQYNIENRDFILKQLRDFAQKLKSLKNTEEKAKSEEDKKEEVIKDTNKKEDQQLPYNGLTSSNNIGLTGSNNIDDTNKPSINDSNENEEIQKQIKSIQDIINKLKEDLNKETDEEKKKQIQDNINDNINKINELNKKIK